VQNPQNIVYNTGGAYTVSLTVDNGIDTSNKTIEDYILVDFVGLEDMNGPDDFRIYPNPGTGIFIIRFAQQDNREVTLTVTDAYGKTVEKNKLLKTSGQYILDLSDKGNGFYFVTLDNGEKKIMKKLSLVK